MAIDKKYASVIDFYRLINIIDINQINSNDFSIFIDWLRRVPSRSKGNRNKTPSQLPLKRIWQSKRHVTLPLRSSRKGPEVGTRNPTKCASNATGPIAVRNITSASLRSAFPGPRGPRHRNRTDLTNSSIPDQE